MLEFVGIGNSRELDEFVMSHPRCHYMQTSCWGKLKSDWLWQGILSRDDAGKSGAQWRCCSIRCGECPST